MQTRRERKLERPKRRTPDDKLKQSVLDRQNGCCARTGERIVSIFHAQFNHFPALGVRPVLEDGTDYDPPQLDPNYIEAVLPEAHKALTHGPRVEKRRMMAAGGDRAAIEKADRLRRRHQAHKEKMASKVGRTLVEVLSSVDTKPKARSAKNSQQTA